MIDTHALATLRSFTLWFENQLTQKGQAYFNTSSRFYYQADPRLDPAYVAYAAPFKSFVWDSGVSGAQVMTTISGTLGTLQRGVSGMKVDYPNGRVLLPAAFGTGQTISGTYAVMELNVYQPNETQEQIIFGNKYGLNSRFARSITGLPAPHSMVTPCVFVADQRASNQPFALGGLYDTTNDISITVMAERNNQLAGVISLIADMKDATFPLISERTWPLDELGDLKTGALTYEEMKTQYGDSSNLYAVDDVDASKLSDSTKINEGIFIGIGTATVSKVRSIR
jgi:hypothetical protein